MEEIYVYEGRIVEDAFYDYPYLFDGGKVIDIVDVLLHFTGKHLLIHITPTEVEEVGKWG